MSLLRGREQGRGDDFPNDGGGITERHVVDGMRLKKRTVDGGLLVHGLNEIVARSVVLGLTGLLHRDATVVLCQQAEGGHGRAALLIQKVIAVEKGGLSSSDVGLVGNVVHAAGAIRLGKVIHLRGTALSLVSSSGVGTSRVNVGNLLGRAGQRKNEIELVVEGTQGREEGGREVGNLVRHGQMRWDGLLQQGMRGQLRGSCGPVQRQVGGTPLQIGREGRILIQDDVGVGNVVFHGTVGIGLLGIRQRTGRKGHVVPDGELLEGVRPTFHHDGIVPVHQVLLGILDGIEVVLDVLGWIGIAKVHRGELLRGRTRPTIAQMVHGTNATSESLDSQGQDVVKGEASEHPDNEDGRPNEDDEPRELSQTVLHDDDAVQSVCQGRGGEVVAGGS